MMPLSAAGAVPLSPALRVLSDLHLLRLVYSFVPNMEDELRVFQQSVVAKLHDPRQPGGLASPFEWLGLLSQAAMFFGDRYMLGVLIHVNKCPHHAHHPSKSQAWTLEMAAHAGVRRGRLDLLDYLLAAVPDYRIKPDLLRLAIAGGDRRVMDWVCAHIPRQQRYVDGRVLDAVAKDGRLEVVRWMHERGFSSSFSARTLDLAAGSGSLELVRFLHENRREGCSADAMDRAATSGHLDIVLFLHRHRREGCTAHAMDGAAKNGHLEVVRFLHASRKEGCTAAALNYAATNGHADVLRFLVERRDEGCLFEARNCSLLRGYSEQAAYLSAMMRPDVTLCSVRMHSAGWTGRRQCQRDDEDAASAKGWRKPWHALLSHLHG